MSEEQSETFIARLTREFEKLRDLKKENPRLFWPFVVLLVAAVPLGIYYISKPGVQIVVPVDPGLRKQDASTPGFNAAQTTSAKLSCMLDDHKVQFAGPDSSRTAAILSVAARMRSEFGTRNYSCTLRLADLLLSVNQNSGHGLSYAGEVWRIRKTDPSFATGNLAEERMREHFLRYIDAEREVPKEERDGKAEACYRRANGFCEERTAWISHILAIDYYQRALAAKDQEARRRLAERASALLEADIEFGGFDQMKPTPTLKRDIADLRRTLNGQ